MRSDFSDYSHVPKFAFLEFNFNSSFSSCRLYSVELEESSPLWIGKETICRYCIVRYYAQIGRG